MGSVYTLIFKFLCYSYLNKDEIIISSKMKVNISLSEKVGMRTVELCMFLDNILEYVLE